MQNQSSETSTTHFGSARDGKALNLKNWPCARSHNGDGDPDPCDKAGQSLCAKCHQVKYCSKACQTVHWKLHKKYCNSPYASDLWLPSWMKERRDPAFVTRGSEAPTPVIFGSAGAYLWGNLPAYDCLNPPVNEGADSRAGLHPDLTLAFAASGDIRNLVKTINSLPENYQGQCTVIVNDFHPQVTVRNLMVLTMLLDTSSTIDPEELAEAVLHLLYSSAITKAQSLLMKRYLDLVVSSNESSSPGWASGTPVKPIFQYQLESTILAFAKRLVNSSYSWEAAKGNMHRVMLAPSRIDYRDRHLAGLRARHRAASLRWWDTGLVVPFGHPVEEFSEPNRLLFSPSGEWPLMDNANPLSAWDGMEVGATRKALGLPVEDIFGSLFFHIKGELTKFIKRMRTPGVKIRFILFSVDLLLLPEMVDIALGNPVLYDRVETSNVMDTLGPTEILKVWGPLLNRRNRHSTLLLQSMNWSLKVPNGTPDSFGSRTIEKLTKEMCVYFGITRQEKWDPASMAKYELFKSRAMNCLAAFFDSGPPFQEFLAKHKVSQTCSPLGIRQRKVPRIHAARIGVKIDEADAKKITLSPEEFYLVGGLSDVTWSERFLEFEAVDT